jgi:hypothetical protein
MRAVGATLALVGAHTNAFSVEAGTLSGCIRPWNWRTLICSTACDRPLFLAEARDIARATHEPVLVIRLDTALSPQSYVTFDAFVSHNNEIEESTTLWPCVQQYDHRLWLIDPDVGTGRLFLDDSGLHRSPAAAPLQVDAARVGAANATAYFRSTLWGGL